MELADKENESFLKNKIALMETTKLKQERMACYKRVLEKSRQ
jgi:hypothetical protein